METGNIKSYAPKARLEFMDAVAKRLNTFGISVNKKGELQVTEAIIQGSVLQIGDNNFDSKLAPARKRLVERSEQLGYAQLVEQVAYTWFNRLCAIRYMEIHGYLGHGFRVLSHPNGDKRFEILDHAQDAAEDLGLDREYIIDLMLAGNKNEELYRKLLLSQCHKLHEAMPFLFESLNDETELLLPDNLTRTDSILRGLVDSIPEEDWQQVEVIGWLYQFYISEKKDQVIGKVVKSEDIPAATQLFTPNWIVRYMVQNSLGAQWLATYPKSPLKAQMEYYIEPAEQTDEVNAQLKAITPESLNPEELTLIDPASGSGHILVEAYDLFKAIYLERGYRQRDIAQLILEKNLFGLDIDQRAAQLTGFALMMKGREDDRRLFERGVKLNVMAMVDSTSLDVDTLVHGIDLSRYGLQPEHLIKFKDLFESATILGALIQIPRELSGKLTALKQLTELSSQDMFVSEVLDHLAPLVRQFELLEKQYHGVVANPPYMGIRYQMPELKGLLAKEYLGAGGDLYSCFIRRLRKFTLDKPMGRTACVAPYTWMFLSDYESLRSEELKSSTITSVVKLEYNAFEPAAVPVAAWCTLPVMHHEFKGSFIELGDFKGAEQQSPKTLEAINNRLNCHWYFEVKQSSFDNIPGKALSFWLSEDVSKAFVSSSKLGQLIDITGSQTVTANNSLFLRYWFEVARPSIGKETKKKWKVYAKGGKFRRWYGNLEWVINWSAEAREFFRKNTSSSMLAEKYWFREGVTYTDITTLGFTARYLPEGCLYDKAGPSMHSDDPITTLAYLNSSVAATMIGALNPTMHCQVKDVSALPGDVTKSLPEFIKCGAKRLIDIYKSEWDSHEVSLDFLQDESVASHVDFINENQTLKYIVDKNFGLVSQLGDEAKALQVSNDVYFLEKMSIANLDRPLKDGRLVTFNSPWCDSSLPEQFESIRLDYYKFVGRKLISYTIGCMMGRYSLDEPGLIYANSGNEGFDASRYTKFPADDDGIIPLTDKEWFADDAANRLFEFISVAWDKAHLEENLDFLAANLSPKKGEGSRDTIRRYLCDKFYKDHMQTYKKRPIYWLFSSGKQKAFQCLVYLHRYNESTLARMRTEYVIPLLGKYEAYAEQLDKQLEMAESTQDKKRLETELKSMNKKQSELREFDDKLKHYADMRISIDLDDGVKENYGRFGDLLADVKNITGEKPEIINAN
jgi:hypothetical protein